MLHCLQAQQGVTICGFYGNHNLGDEAMLSGLIRLLRDVEPALPVTVLSADPTHTRSCHGVDAVRRSLSPLRPPAVRAMLRQPLFVLGGGDLLRDTPTSLVARAWLRFLDLAIRLRRRTVVAGVSVGDISQADTRERIPRTLSRVDVIAVRDEDSRQRLLDLGVERPVLVMTDLALAALNAPGAPRPRAARPQIGVSVRFLYERGTYADAAGFERFLDELAATLDQLIERHGAEVHLLPLCTRLGPVDAARDDYVCSLELARRCRHSQQLTVHRYLDTPDALVAQLSRLDLLIGMRLHALILALGSGVPVVAAEYDRKVRGFMHEVEQSDRSIPLAQFERGQVGSLCEQLLDAREAESRRVLTGVANYRQRVAPFQAELARLAAG